MGASSWHHHEASLPGWLAIQSHLQFKARVRCRRLQTTFRGRDVDCFANRCTNVNLHDTAQARTEPLSAAGARNGSNPTLSGPDLENGARLARSDHSTV